MLHRSTFMDADGHTLRHGRLRHLHGRVHSGSECAEAVSSCQDRAHAEWKPRQHHAQYHTNLGPAVERLRSHGRRRGPYRRRAAPRNHLASRQWWDRCWHHWCARHVCQHRHPRGTGGYLTSWNVDGEASQAPDVAFIRDLISLLKTYDNVDAGKISIFGNSNGSAMTNRLLIEPEIRS